MNIRPAGMADLSAVYGLFEQELAYQKTLIDGGDQIPNLDWQKVINRKITNPRECMWIAELNGNLVGYVMGCPGQTWALPSPNSSKCRWVQADV